MDALESLIFHDSAALCQYHDAACLQFCFFFKRRSASRLQLNHVEGLTLQSSLSKWDASNTKGSTDVQ